MAEFRLPQLSSRLTFWRRAALPGLFLLCALPVMLWLALAVPLGEVPDEPTHIARADSLLHGTFIGHRTSLALPDGYVVTASGFMANRALIRSSFASGVPPADKRMTKIVLDADQQEPWDPHPVFVEASNTAPYPPFLYVPGAIGIGVAKALGASPYISIIAARIVNAATYLAIGVIALVLGRGIAPMLFAVLLLPMSLFLGASCNQDGMLIACSVMAAALLSRARGPQGALYWGAGVILALVIAAKPVYLPVSAMMLMAGLPSTPTVGAAGRWGALRAFAPGRRFMGFALAALPPVLWFALARATASSPFLSWPPYEAGPLWPGGAGQIFHETPMADNLRVLLANPGLLLTLPWTTLGLELGYKVKEIIGVFGQLNVLMPSIIYRSWLAVLPLAALGVIIAGPRKAAPIADRAAALRLPMMIVVLTLSIHLVYIGQYLSWTHVGTAVVQGVQGRYFIPLLPILALGLPRFALPGGGVLRAVAIAPTAAMALIGIAVVPATIVLQYYLG